MNVFRVCCPLIPLVDEGKGYPKDYELPKRQRPVDSLNIPRLCSVLRESLLYEEVHENLDLAVVGVLSPYTLGLHVMVIDLSPNRYCPDPQSFTATEFSLITNLCARVLNCMSTEQSVRCIGYNCSPYAWGDVEERGGCQSVMTKFHMMIWQWDHAMMEPCDEVPETHKELFGGNCYNEHFAHIVWKECGDLFRGCDLFGSCSFGPRGLFVRFAKGKTTTDVCRQPEFLRLLAVRLESLLERLTTCLTDLDLRQQRELLQQSAQRMLTDEELALLRTKPNAKDFAESMTIDCDDHEKQLLACLHPSVCNRCGQGDESKPLWEKGFGYSLVMCDSEYSDLESGMRIALHPHCGPGGVAEVLGCYLTRPENRIADEEVMMRHNSILWSLSKSLAKHPV